MFKTKDKIDLPKDMSLFEFMDSFIYGLIAESGLDVNERELVIMTHDAMFKLLMERIDFAIFSSLNEKQFEYYKNLLETNAPGEKVVEFIEENVTEFPKLLLEVMEAFRTDYSSSQK